MDSKREVINAKFAIWRKNNIEKVKSWYKKYFQKTKKKREESTNRWRENISPDQKLVGYTDATLYSFKKSKLISIIRELEKRYDEKK